MEIYMHIHINIYILKFQKSDNGPGNSTKESIVCITFLFSSQVQNSQLLKNQLFEIIELSTLYFEFQDNLVWKRAFLVLGFAVLAVFSSVYFSFPGSGGLCTLVMAFLAGMRWTDKKVNFTVTSSAHDPSLIKLFLFNFFGGFFFFFEVCLFFGFLVWFFFCLFVFWFCFVLFFF